MSVHTEADRAIDQATANIHEAAYKISSVIIGDIDGYDKYNDGYKEKLKEVLIELLNIRDMLK